MSWSRNIRYLLPETTAGPMERNCRARSSFRDGLLLCVPGTLQSNAKPRKNTIRTTRFPELSEVRVARRVLIVACIMEQCTKLRHDWFHLSEYEIVPLCRPECGIAGCLSHVTFVVAWRNVVKYRSETITAKKQTARINVPSLVDICLSTPEVPLSSILVPERIHFMPCIALPTGTK